MEKGKFIVIEGIDGCGGQTQTELLMNHLGKDNTLFLSFPAYETKLGEIIDNFLHKKIVYRDKDVEILAYYADILQFKPVILESTNEGRNVISDRYFTSTIVYQSLFGTSTKEILRLDDIFKLPTPDICFLLDISVEESQKRKIKEKQGVDNLDRNESDLEFLNKVRERYLEVAQDQVFCKWEVIDGEKSINEVFNNIISKL